MAAALFAQQVERHVDEVEVSSAGLLEGGSCVPDEVVEAMAPYGIDLSGHRSRLLTRDLLERSDLVVGMGRRHVQEAVLLDPPCWPRAFKLKELVRRGGEHGPRRPDQGIRPWIGEVHGDRTRTQLADRANDEEVDDPYGGTSAGYRATAGELEGLTAQLVRLLWPGDPDPGVG